MKYITASLVILLFASCHKPVARNNEITKIEVATGGCLKGCPVTAVRIDNFLTMNYYGGYNAKLKGYYRGKVTQGFWDSLNVSFEQIKYK